MVNESSIALCRYCERSHNPTQPCESKGAAIAAMGDEKAVIDSKGQAQPDIAPEAAVLESGCVQPSSTNVLNRKKDGK